MRMRPPQHVESDNMVHLSNPVIPAKSAALQCEAFRSYEGTECLYVATLIETGAT